LRASLTSVVATAGANPFRISDDALAPGRRVRFRRVDALAVLFTQWSAWTSTSLVASAAATLCRVVTVKRGKLTLVAIDDGVDGDLEAGARRPSVSTPASSIGWTRRTA